jgi:hypothetical protein
MAPAAIQRATLLLGALLVIAAAGAPSAGARVIWLCKPGHRPDPCTPGLSTTVYSPKLAPLRVVHPRQVRKPGIDCFYVYPTVSDQTTTLSNRQLDPEQRSIALYQAARYSQYCRVFAPIYRQVTVPALDAGDLETPADLRTPYADVRTAFETYLRKYNHGRGFVLIGHSQGSFILNELIAREIDRKPAVRRRLVSAILLGGNVLVKRGKNVGGTFQHVPACRSATELGCVIAYSTFDQTPPPDSAFGRTTVPADQVLCVNPAALLGQPTVDAIIPSAPFAPGSLLSAGLALIGLTLPHPPTVWAAEPHGYAARCETSAGAHVLELKALHGAQVPQPSPGPVFGLHLVDASIELGDLVTVVGREALAFRERVPMPMH